MNIKSRNVLFFLICFCMPFIYVPKILHFTIIGGPIGKNLILIPIILFYVYTFHNWKKENFIFFDNKIVGLYLVTFFIFLVISLMHGLIIYPYYDKIFSGPTGQIDRLSSLISFFNLYSISVNQIFLLKIWMIVRFFKAILLELIYTFFFSYLVYCWFRKDPQVAICLLKKSIYAVACIISFYSTIELFYFFGYEWARNMLIHINPILHVIKDTFNWWPPLLWEVNRIRSIFPEPSFFGMYAAFILPFFWGNIINNVKIKFSLFMTLYISLLQFLTLSKTAVILLGIEFLLFIGYILFLRKLKYVKKGIIILILTGVAFYGSLICPFYYNNYSVAQIATQSQQNTESASQYVNNYVIGVAKKDVGSNGTRYAIIRSDFYIGLDHFVLGVGSNLKNAYTTDYLLESEKKGEILRCLLLQEKLGILKTGYPTVSEFSKRFSENGMIGLIMYLLPTLFLIIIIFRYRRQYSFTEQERNIIVCTGISFLGSFVFGGSGMLTTIYTYWILLGILYAYLYPNKIR